MKLNATLADFLRSDPDYEPFGLSWLRGLTPARVGLVAGVCLLVLLRVYSTDLLQDKPTPVLNWMFWITLDTAQWLRNVFPAVLLVTVADNVSADARTPVRVLGLAAALVAGACLAGAMAWLVACSDEMAGCRMSAARCLLAEIATGTGGARFCFLNFFFLTLSWGALLTGALFFLQRERRMAAATQRASLDRVDLDRQMAEVRLQMLQAQIEPHFLFNSLATILGLYREDAREGSRLIKDLADYLRGALPHMRETISTLRRELASGPMIPGSAVCPFEPVRAPNWKRFWMCLWPRCSPIRRRSQPQMAR